MIETDNILTKALSQALETMAFLTIMPIEEDLVIPEKTILAEISFTGPKSGTIQILAGLDFCRILAENISAFDKVNNETCCDAIKELSNVTCGLLLPVIASSPTDVFDVTVPTSNNGLNSPKWHEFAADKNSCVLNVEGYAVVTKLLIED